MTDIAHLLRLTENECFAEFAGEVSAIGQGFIEATGPLCSLGEICLVGEGNSAILAEVVSVEPHSIRLIPLTGRKNLRPGDRVRRSDRHSRIGSGQAFVGRAVDGFGSPIDGGPAIPACVHRISSNAGALEKTIVADRVATGFRVIDTLFPLAKGQRIGIFAAAGVGKTTLVEHLASHIDCDHVVACLIGERGREVERFWELQKDAGRKDRLTLVAATSDLSASERVRAIHQALALCEKWRDDGKHVVLFVDSVTRLAMALREIGLAAGEPPSVRSYTPNVFSALPGIVERCGAIKGRGAITAIFTVLSETDDVDDPIVETMKSILDGHLVLSRKLADRGHFPAIDIAASISRVADQLLPATTLSAARSLRASVAEFESARPMIESGIYQRGSSRAIDAAIDLHEPVLGFVRQARPVSGDLASVDAQLANLVAGRPI